MILMADRWANGLIAQGATYFTNHKTEGALA